MNRKRVLLSLLAVATTVIHDADAQTREQLLEENRQLRAQLDGLAAKGCRADTPGPASYKDGAISATVESLRVGPVENSRHSIAVTTSIALRNTGNSPLVLNYEYKTFSLTDDRGYQYELRSEGYDAKQVVKGIPMANSSRADTSAVMHPGESRTVTFIATRQMKDGQTPGSLFDINATFGEYFDEGQGRIRKGRQHPVSFSGVPAGAKVGATVPEAAKRKTSEAVGRLLEGLVK